MVNGEQDEDGFVAELVDETVPADGQLEVPVDAEFREFRRHGAEPRLVSQQGHPVAQFRERAGPGRSVEASKRPMM